MKTHYTIPVFILHKGCPFKCVFCDQARITGEDMTSPADVNRIIRRHLATIPESAGRIEVGFFGGTFTGLDISLQKEFLEPVQAFIKEGTVHGIRLSTRPDYINSEVLRVLKGNGVTSIELGVQSTSDRVLAAAKRGHTASDTERASRLIIKEGFLLGHQMMLGLPGSGWEEELATARKAVKLGAKEVRIYPAIVMKGTELAEMWQRGEYRPLEEGEAARRTARLIMYFGSHGVKVIRCGLHPSEGLVSGVEFLAGPFHPAFRQKAESLMFAFKMEELLEREGKIDHISINPQDEAAFFGFKGSNGELINKFAGGADSVKRDSAVSRGEIRVR